jgi:hypothetical protein
MRINEMQRKLATWTATDEKRKVNRLLRVISHPLWLSKAAEIQPFMWRLPESNPYLRLEVRNTITSYYEDVAMAISHK